MKTKEFCEVAWDHGSCCLHCLTTTTADGKSDVAQAELSAEDVTY